MTRYDCLQDYFSPQLLAIAVGDELDCEECPAKEGCPDGVPCCETFLDWLLGEAEVREKRPR